MGKKKQNNNNKRTFQARAQRIDAPPGSYTKEPTAASVAVLICPGCQRRDYADQRFLNMLSALAARPGTLHVAPRCGVCNLFLEISPLLDATTTMKKRKDDEEKVKVSSKLLKGVVDQAIDVVQAHEKKKPLMEQEVREELARRYGDKWRRCNIAHYHLARQCLLVAISATLPHTPEATLADLDVECRVMVIDRDGVGRELAADRVLPGLWEEEGGEA